MTILGAGLTNLNGKDIGTDDTLTLTSGDTVYGDALNIYQQATGGNDTITGADNATNNLFGDADQMYGAGVGGNDTLTGGAGATAVNNLYGDAYSMSQRALGGDDWLTGGANGATNTLFGDAYQMSDSADGGVDTLTGGADADNTLFGDAYQMSDRTTGGNDILTGGLNAPGYTDTLYGDAFTMSGTAIAGNDILTAGDGGINHLYGDADNVSDRAICGNDTLISGTGTDYMWGDAQTINGSKVTTGADTFVFKPNSGADVIEDFRQSDGDKIDVSAYGFTNLASIPSITASGSTTLINFGSGNVELLNFTGTLTSADFIFST